MAEEQHNDSAESASTPDQPQDQPEPQEPQDAPQAEGDNLPPNRFEVEDSGTLKKKITITVPHERIEAKYDEMYGEIGQSAQVPGFRIGRAPRRLIEKRFGKEVSSDVRNSLIGEALGEVDEKSDLKTIGEPELNLDEIQLPDEGDMTFSFEVEVQPEFELPELTGMEVKKPKIEIDDTRIDEYLEEMQGARARYIETDEPAAEGDLLAAGATIRGEGLETVERPGLTLRVAPGQIEGLPLVDLGEQLAGKKAGDTLELAITAPESHPNEDWRGKELKITLHISQVRRREVPEINDEFASSWGLDSMQELRELVRERLAGRVEAEVLRSMREQVAENLLDKTSLDLPEGVAKRHAAGVLRRQYIEMLQMGIPRERIDERITELQTAAAEQAERELKLQFILGRIAEEKSLAVTEGEVNARIAQMAAMYNRRPERLRQELAADGSLAQVESSLLDDKAVQWILDQAKIVEVDPSEMKEGEDAQAEAKKAAAETEKE